ncbi:Transcriptional regulator, MerR family [hydrothermal vent metagenome]|uniref:Transcriptional regulator, MerR family n=1 Tax=hydrothermal vent metagenome TaxID=652676 RepID=A0A3B0VS03_9ZZZZ
MKQPRAREQQIPDKTYFRIGEVSGLVGVDCHVLRYWESEFKVIRPRRAKSNQRLYRRQDVENLLLIKSLLYGNGYTISGARRLLKSSSDADLTKEEKKDDSRSHDLYLATIKKELRRIQQLLATKSLRL